MLDRSSQLIFYMLLDRSLVYAYSDLSGPVKLRLPADIGAFRIVFRQR